MRLAIARLYTARGTDTIRAEWTRNPLSNPPDIAPEQLARSQRLINAALPQARATGYESRIDALTLPDPNDRQVLGATIEGKASVILTFNLKHFPAAQLAPHGISAIHPDQFAGQLYRYIPNDFCRGMTRASRQPYPPRQIRHRLPRRLSPWSAIRNQ